MSQNCPYDVPAIRARLQKHLESLNLWGQWAEVGRRAGGYSSKQVGRWATGGDNKGDAFSAEFAGALHHHCVMDAVYLLTGEGSPEVVDQEVEALAFDEIARLVDRVRSGQTLEHLAALTESDGDGVGTR